MDSQRMVSALLLVVAVAFLAVEKTNGVIHVGEGSDIHGSTERKLLAAEAAAKPAAKPDAAAAAAGPAAAPASGDAATAPATGAPEAAAGPGSASTGTDASATTDGGHAASGDKPAEDKKASAAMGPNAKAFGMTAFVSSALACVVMM